MPINGNYYDWESIEITLPGGTLIDVNEISYQDEKEITEVYGKGGMPRGYGRGNYKAEGKLTLKREEFNRMAALVGTFETAPLPIVCRYANDDQDEAIDVLKDCKFNTREFKAAQGDTSFNVTLGFRILGGVFAGGLPPQNLL